MIRADPGLRFWLDFVTLAGGLWEDFGDSAQVLLPESLQQKLDLPEDMAVTADPDVARTDGALLLTVGHPVLTRAAENLLAAGDTGALTLARPHTAAPTAVAANGVDRSIIPDSGTAGSR